LHHVGLEVLAKGLLELVAPDRGDHVDLQGLVGDAIGVAGHVSPRLLEDGAVQGQAEGVDLPVAAYRTLEGLLMRIAHRASPPLGGPSPAGRPCELRSGRARPWGRSSSSRGRSARAGTGCG